MILDKIKIQPVTYQRLSTINILDDAVVFNQSDKARGFFPCQVEKIVGHYHILPETLFNIIDFSEDTPKTELYVFGSHATAIAFMQLNKYICSNSSVWMIVANEYPKAYIDYMKSLYPFIKRLCLVFPNTLYGFIDDLKTLIYWKGFSQVDFHLSYPNIHINFDENNVILDVNKVSLSAFKRQYASRFYFHKVFKTPLVDYKYSLNILQHNIAIV